MGEAQTITPVRFSGKELGKLVVPLFKVI